jgi:hypothetical protein
VVTPVVQTACALCTQPATLVIEPARQTLDRGPDPTDQSFSITVMLPGIPLCEEHVVEVRQGDRLVGWCDDERCRTYGEAGGASVCGQPYEQIASKTRSRSTTPKSH